MDIYADFLPHRSRNVKVRLENHVLPQVKHFGHREPVVTKVTVGRERFVKISSIPVKVHESSADGLVADARSQAGGRVLRIRCSFF